MLQLAATAPLPQLAGSVTQGELANRLQRLLHALDSFETKVDARVEKVGEALDDPDVGHSVEAVREATRNEVAELRLAALDLESIASELKALELDVFTDGVDPE